MLRHLLSRSSGICCILFALSVSILFLSTGHARSQDVLSTAVPAAPTSLALGGAQSCAVTDGALRCWGGNFLGQLGTGDAFDRPVPAAVKGLGSGVLMAAAGSRHTCALTQAGGVQCWGGNDQGQLGNGSSAPSKTPVEVSGLTAGVKFIAAGYDHTCAVMSSGSVKCWGLNANGQLGAGPSGSISNAPVNVVGLGNVTDLALGGAHSCALSGDGRVKCWGYNFYGSLGTGDAMDRNTPVDVVNLADVRQLQAGYLHTCALLNSGAVNCWGAFADLWTNQPTQMPGFSNIKVIAANGSFLCGLKNDGAVQCMGANSAGQLGDGTTTDRNTPVKVVELANVAHIAAGAGHACALLSTGVRCWGNDNRGQLGVGNSSYVRSPLDALTGVTYASIAMGWLHACGITSTGAVMCWGQSYNGELGIGPVQQASTFTSPQAVSGLSSGATVIAAGLQYGCAVVNGKAWCWGRNADGQLGNGSTKDAATPTAVIGLSSGATKIAVSNREGGDDHACAVVGGAAKCWGNNYLGQLGKGVSDVMAPETTPVNVVGLSSGVSDIAAGAMHSCAVVNGGVKCWGLNYYGQLGTGSSGTYTRFPAPLPVVGLSSGVTAVVAGHDFNCALIGGGAKCWGRGDQGQLGVPSYPSLSVTPVTPSGMDVGVTSIAAGRTNACAAKNGAIFCWGDGEPIPRQVFMLDSGYTKVATGGNAHCAIGAAGVLCWGDAASGKLGDGRVSFRSAPEPVLGFGPGPELYVNHTNARPGSLLTLSGANFTPFANLPLLVNGLTLGSVRADHQGFVRIVLKSAGAAPGYYGVQTLANGALVERGVTLNNTAPLAGAEGGSTLGALFNLAGGDDATETPAPKPSPTPTQTPAPDAVAAAPVVTQVSPSQGGADLPAEVEIFGQNFKDGAVARLNPGELAALRTVYHSSTHLTALWPGAILPRNYTVTVLNPDWKRGDLTAGYTALEVRASSPAVQDDLYGFDYELSASQPVEYVGQGTQLRFVVHRLGGATNLSNIHVRFYVGKPDLADPASQATLVGDGVITALAPNRAIGLSVAWTPSQAGTFEAYAVIDAQGSVTEANESNNLYHNWVQVEMAQPADVIPPVIDAVSAPLVTSNSSIHLSIQAHDAGGSGLAWVDLVVWEYFASARAWLATDESGWMPFDGLGIVDYDLGYFAGPRFIDVWVADAARNVSTEAKSVLVNYLKANDFVVQGESQLYLLPLQQGAPFSADLRPLFSLDDADLYLWPPDYPARPYWVSANDGVTPEHLAVNAPVAGYYWLEVYGYASSFYTLAVGGVAGVDAALPPEANAAATNARPPRSDPPGMDSQPSHIFRLSRQPIRTYLPLVQR